MPFGNLAGSGTSAPSDARRALSGQQSSMLSEEKPASTIPVSTMTWAMERSLAESNWHLCVCTGEGGSVSGVVVRKIRGRESAVTNQNSRGAMPHYT